MLVTKKSFNFPKLGLFTDIGLLEIFIGTAFLILISYFSYIYFFSGKYSDIFYSYGSGKYDQPIYVALKSNIWAAEIHYTTDGTEPVLQSEIYNKPVYINKSAVLKSKAFRNGYALGETHSETILIHEATKLPVVSITMDYADLWDPIKGIYTDENDTQQNLSEEEIEDEIEEDAKEDEEDRKEAEEEGKTIEPLSAEEIEEDRIEVIKLKMNWSRPAKVEFFDTNRDLPSFTKNVTIRIYGGKTRNNPQKSIKLCTNQNDSIIYPIFPDYDVTKFKCLLLRNSGGDWRHTMFRDGFMQQIVSENSLVTTQNYRPAVVYINGEYWGIQNIREAYNDNFLANKYNGKRTDYALLFPNREKRGRIDVEAGVPRDAEDFAFIRELVDEDINDPATFQTVQDAIDIDNFFDYNIFETYFGNDDWLENNIKIWRYNGVDKHENTTYGNDGKFRWMLYDLDSGFGTVRIPPYDKNVLKSATQEKDADGRGWPYVILRRLLGREDTRNQFINKYLDRLNTTFLPQNIIPKIDKFEADLQDEMPRHIDRWRETQDAWGMPSIKNLDEWRANVQRLRDFANQRPAHAYEHLKLQFNLTDTYKIKFTGLDNTKGTIRVNSIYLNQNEWEGTYFSQIPIQVEAVPTAGYKFVGWEGNRESSDSKLEIANTSDIQLTPIFEYE